MSKGHRFGGVWTEEKLSRLSKYLSAYMTIFKSNPGAKWFKTNYVDAFAGTGFRSDSRSDEGPTLFEDEEASQFQQGSTSIALESEPPFDNYIFIDNKPEHIQALSDLKDRYSRRNISLIQDDANSFLSSWAGNTDWRKNRAVVFLDPYGTQVDWTTMESLANTKAVDLWLLFPVGQAVNRMLMRREPIQSWADRLDRIFGTTNWRAEFYRESNQLSFFDDKTKSEKNADFNKIGDYFVQRLMNIFPGVAKPRSLFNSKGIPIYLLCFAAC